MSTIKIKTPPMPDPGEHFVFAGLDWHRATPCYFKQAVGRTNCLPLFTADQLAARDAQWQEMYRPIVEALSRFNRATITPDGHIIGLMRDDFEAARAALSAITEN